MARHQGGTIHAACVSRVQSSRPRNESQGMLAVFLVALAAPLGSADDWPQILGPERNGVSAEKGLALNWPKDGPPLVWDKQVGEGFSAPVVAGERLIVFHRVGDEEVVECLHAGTGKRVWQAKQPTQYEDQLGKGNGPRATPVIA